MNEIGWVGGFNRREIGHGKDPFELNVIRETLYLHGICRRCNMSCNVVASLAKCK